MVNALSKQWAASLWAFADCSRGEAGQDHVPHQLGEALNTETTTPREQSLGENHQGHMSPSRTRCD